MLFGRRSQSPRLPAGMPHGRTDTPRASTRRPIRTPAPAPNTADHGAATRSPSMGTDLAAVRRPRQSLARSYEPMSLDRRNKSLSLPRLVGGRSLHRSPYAYSPVPPWPRCSVYARRRLPCSAAALFSSVSTLIAVVLSELLGPRSEKIVLARTARSIPSRPTVAPVAFRSSETAMAVVM
jgi:hypothetical protein